MEAEIMALVSEERRGTDGRLEALVGCASCGETRWLKRKSLHRKKTRYCKSCASRNAARISHKRTIERGAILRTNGEVSWFYTTEGYVVGYWPEHPLAAESSAQIRQHWHIYWAENDCADWVVRAKKTGAQLHHKNGVRDDNRIENLELRWPSRHPKGWTTDAMIGALESMGYEVRKRS